MMIYDDNDDGSYNNYKVKGDQKHTFGAINLIEGEGMTIRTSTCNYIMMMVMSR